RGVFTISYATPEAAGDRDGDGIHDDTDQCPDEPEDADDFEDENGCPDPDNDQDTVLDVDEECDNVPEDRDGLGDEDGCPEEDFESPAGLQANRRVEFHVGGDVGPGCVALH